MGWHGSEIHTPNLDALAMSGVRLDHSYVQPICSPYVSEYLYTHGTLVDCEVCARVRVCIWVCVCACVCVRACVYVTRAAAGRVT